MTLRRMVPSLLTGLLVLVVVVGGAVVVKGSRDVPSGFCMVARSITPELNDPFVALENEIIDSVPAFREILDSAAYWAHLNMNETRHWITGEEVYQIRTILENAYLDKYGLNSFQYADTYHSSTVYPVVVYGMYYFAIIEQSLLGGVPVSIQHVQLQETDAYVEWNGTELEAIPGLEDALDKAMEWALHDVDEIVYYFEPYDYDLLLPTLEQIYIEKYGMDWFQYYLEYNTSIFLPVVSYRGNYFSMDFTQAGEQLPLPDLLQILLPVIIFLIGFGLLSVTLVNYRRLQSEHKH